MDSQILLRPALHTPEAVARQYALSGTAPVHPTQTVVPLRPRLSAKVFAVLTTTDLRAALPRSDVNSVSRDITTTADHAGKRGHRLLCVTEALAAAILAWSSPRPAALAPPNLEGFATLGALKHDATNRNATPSCVITRRRAMAGTVPDLAAPLTHKKSAAMLARLGNENGFRACHTSNITHYHAFD